MRRESECVPEETSALSCESCSLACDGHVLAGEPSTNKVGSSHKSDSISELNGTPHIVMLRYIRPMLIQNLSAMLINLNLGDTFVTCAFQAKIKPADTSEQGHEPHKLMSLICIVEGVYSIHIAV
jgi:hypothetical protein